ncbi:MAG: AtpZ/AtpI family protein [Kordiimonadaceae bacterium]|nr:AtpZ/AtpI family protein [Kordiimonadaceae bacterium]
MGEDKKNPTEATFGERLNLAQKKAEKVPDPERVSTASGIALKMGVELVAGTGVGAFMGFWIDKWFGTAPLFLIVLLILGFATGVRNVIRQAQAAQEAEESGALTDDTPDAKSD